MITEQWQELKETIMELRDGEGTLTQQEVGEFLVNYMNVLERQDEYEEAVQNILDDIWDSAIEETRKKQVQKLKDINKEIIDYGDEDWIMAWLTIGVPDGADDSDYYYITTDTELLNDCLKFYSQFKEETKEA